MTERWWWGALFGAGLMLVLASGWANLGSLWILLGTVAILASIAFTKRN